MVKYILFFLINLFNIVLFSHAFAQAADLRAANTWNMPQTFNKGMIIPNWSIDVRAYGAVCDGSTNDSPAFELAIAAIGLTGGRAEVPATGHGCKLNTGIQVTNEGYSGIALEGVAGTYFPGYTDNTQSDWLQRGSSIICGDLSNACITIKGNGTIIRNLTFWYNQPTPPSATTCATPCTMTHNWTPTNYPYTILISPPQNFNAVTDVTIINATNCIDVEGPSNGVGSLFTYFEHLNLGCFNSGMMLHRVDNPVELHDVNFNIIWYQASSDLLGYTEGDSTHTGHKVDLSLEYAAATHLSNVKFIQSMTGIYTANETVINGIGSLTFGAQSLYGEGIYFIQDCQAMAVQDSTTILQGRLTDVQINTDPQTSNSTQCGGYLHSAFNLASDNVEFGITNLDGLFANTVATIGGGTGGILHINGASHADNYSAFNNGLAAFVVNSGAALDIDDIQQFFSTNGSAGPHISGDAHWPKTFASGLNIEGPSLTQRTQCFDVAKTTAAFSTNQWCWVADGSSSANFGLYRFNKTTGAFIDIPIGVNNATGIISFNDAIQPNTLQGILGSNLGDDPFPGSVGEFPTNVNTVSLSSAVPAAAATIPLTAGDWDVWCSVNFQPAGTTTSTVLMAQVNTTVALAGPSAFAGTLNVPVSAGISNTVLAPPWRENLTATTPVYCVANATFAVSTMSATGFIRARRMR